MIKIETTMRHADAINLINILDQEHARTLTSHRKFQQQVSANPNNRVADANANWYLNHATYLMGLREQLLRGYSVVTD
jgi:hypothetical protein